MFTFVPSAAAIKKLKPGQHRTQKSGAMSSTTSVGETAASVAETGAGYGMGRVPNARGPASPNVSEIVLTCPGSEETKNRLMGDLMLAWGKQRGMEGEHMSKAADLQVVSTPAELKHSVLGMTQTTSTTTVPKSTAAVLAAMTTPAADATEEEEEEEEQEQEDYFYGEADDLF